MRRIFTILLTGFYLVAAAQGKKEKKLFKTYGVRSVTETVTEISGGKENTRKDSYTVYDKNINVVLNEEYRKDGSLKHKETAKYDSKGNKTEETVWDAADLQPNPEKYVKHVSKFNEDEDKIEELEYDKEDRLVSKTQFSYNSNGEKTLEVVYDNAGKLKKRTVYLYNAKGLKVEKKEYDQNNLLVADRKYIYEF